MSCPVAGLLMRCVPLCLQTLPPAALMAQPQHQHTASGHPVLGKPSTACVLATAPGAQQTQVFQQPPVCAWSINTRQSLPGQQLGPAIVSSELNDCWAVGVFTKQRWQTSSTLFNCVEACLSKHRKIFACGMILKGCCTCAHKNACGQTCDWIRHWHASTRMVSYSGTGTKVLSLLAAQPTVCPAGPPTQPANGDWDAACAGKGINATCNANCTWGPINSSAPTATCELRPYSYPDTTGWSTMGTCNGERTWNQAHATDTSGLQELSLVLSHVLYSNAHICRDVLTVQCEAASLTCGSLRLCAVVGALSPF